MDALLIEIAGTYSKEIEQSTSLLNVIKSIPTRQHERDTITILTKLDSGSEKEKLFESKLRKLLKLETKDESQRNDKAKYLLAAALVEVATMLTSDPNLLMHLKSQSQGDQKPAQIERGSALSSAIPPQSLQAIRKYLFEIKSVGCRNLSIQELDNKKNASELFKRMEKCTRLEIEKIKFELDLEERRAKVDKEQKCLEATLASDKIKLNEIRLLATNLQGEKEQECRVEIQKADSEHEAIMDTFQSELSELIRSLDIATDVHQEEQDLLLTRIADLEENRRSLKEQHEMEAVKIKKAIKVENDYNEQEIAEKAQLSQNLALIDRDAKEKAAEDLIVQQVFEMEEKADAILFHAATSLQRLYRGMRDRKIAKKSKKKNGKGKKGGKGGTKAKKK